MTALVTAFAASGLEAATAVGTLLGAVATAAAVFAALFIGAKDRRAAEAALERQVATIDDRERRERRVDLLLRLSDEVGRSIAYSSAPQGAEALLHIRGLLLALDTPEQLPSLYQRHVPDVSPHIDLMVHERWRHEQDVPWQDRVVREVTDTLREAIT